MPCFSANRTFGSAAYATGMIFCFGATILPERSIQAGDSVFRIARQAVVLRSSYERVLLRDEATLGQGGEVLNAPPPIPWFNSEVRPQHLIDLD